jgi:hypothetical protein
MLARLAAFVFSIIQVLFLLRLALPFVHVPATLKDWTPPLIDVTDLLAAPFQAITNSSTFDLKSAVSNLPAFGGIFTSYTDRLDIAIVVAMIGWGLIAVVVTLILTLVSRAR